MESLNSIRKQFALLRANNKTVNGTIEIVGASFRADDHYIFGKENKDYIQRELDWYQSQSLSVFDIPGGTPKIWQQVSSDTGLINSNYGYLLMSEENGSQIENVVVSLVEDRESRRAVAIYTRPSMHHDWNRDNMRDFICTNAVHYLIRDNKLEVVVQMRSNDAIFGYRNDYAWQKFAQREVIGRLAANSIYVDEGPMTWQVSSLHIYERHFNLVDKYIKTGIAYTDLS